jgi:arginase
LKKNIELIEVCSDFGAGTRGACFSPDALQIMAQLDPHSKLGKLLKEACYIPTGDGFSADCAKSIGQVYRVCRSIAHVVRRQIVKGYFPLLVSGDHSCAAGTIAGIKMAKPHARLGVVWIDAHADLHSPYTTPSGNMHGMPLAASINDDNSHCACRQVDRQTRFLWEQLKNLGNLTPKVWPQDIIYVSLRDLEQEEASLIRKYGIKTISTEMLRKYGVSAVSQRIWEQLGHCTDIYVSFDADCLDASVSKGTGLPVHGGLMPGEAQQLTTMLLENPKTVCFEVTELNPFFDINQETTAIIYQLLEKGIVTLSNVKVTAQLAKIQDKD